MGAPQTVVTLQTSVELSSLIEALTEAIARLVDATRDAADMHRTATRHAAVGRQSTFNRPTLQPLNRCRHSEGHDLILCAGDALSIETPRECPCCAARLWISIPSVAEILEASASRDGCTVPDLEVELTRRERQILNVLHRSPYALRHQQLAALVWSDPDRTHEVRSTLYRLRRKLVHSGWAIPVPERGKGVRLVPNPISDHQPTLQPVRQDSTEASDLLRHHAA